MEIEMLMSLTRLEPDQAPTSARRLAELAIANGFDVLITEARKKGESAKAWAVVGAHETKLKKFQAYWASTEKGGAKAVGQLVDDGLGAIPVQSRQLTAWVGAA